jgi:hypothetical protein
MTAPSPTPPPAQVPDRRAKANATPVHDADTYVRPVGCLCTWEEGDSACPAHPTCPGCGCVVCECPSPTRSGER